MNAYPPMISPRFQVAGGILQYKPYPSYPSWLDAWDVGGLVPSDIQPQIDAIVADIVALTIRVTDVEAAVITAQSTADTALTTATIAESQANVGIADAAVAYGLAETASIDAANALAAATAITPKNRRVTMFHHEANSSGGTLTLNISSLIIDNHQAFSVAQGFNAYHSFACDLMPACKLFFIGVTNNSSGIMGIHLDGSFLTTLDWYSAAQVLNVIKSVSFAANVLTAGRHTLRLEVVTKNGSSSNYHLTLTKYWLAPDVD